LLCDCAPTTRISTRGLAAREARASEEIAAVLFVTPMTKEIAASAPLCSPHPHAPWGIRVNGMDLQSPPHPNATQVLADCMVTVAGQKEDIFVH
jgi:hypothetical protein